MAESVLETRQSFEQLSISSNQKKQRPANFTVQTPDKNVTLVLNFSNGGFTPQPLAVTADVVDEERKRSPPSRAQPRALRHQMSVDSIHAEDSSSMSAESQSPSGSPLSSTPSSPDLNRNTIGLSTVSPTSDKPVTKHKVRQANSVEVSKPPPTRRTLDKFLSSQQIHPTVSLSEVNNSDVYSESWVRKKHYLSFIKHHRIRDVKFDGDCNVILTSRHSIQLYDANGHFMERLYLDKIKEPWGIHVHDNGNVFVSDHHNDCVKEFTHIGIQINKYGPVPSPCGVAVSSSSYVFICSQADGCVYVFDKNNKLVRKIGEGILTSPAHIVLHGKLVLVSDEARIIGFTTENAVAYVYGHSDSTNHPACLTIDRKTGFALATAYYKGSIIAVKRDMNRALMVKDSTRPILCALSPYGHLLVGERLSKGVQFKMYRVGKDV